MAKKKGSGSGSPKGVRGGSPKTGKGPRKGMPTGGMAKTNAKKMSVPTKDSLAKMDGSVKVDMG